MIETINQGGGVMPKSYDDNRADQLNPNNDAYWQSRGEDERPDDWDSRDITDPQDSSDDGKAEE